MKTRNILIDEKAKKLHRNLNGYFDSNVGRYNSDMAGAYREASYDWTLFVFLVSKNDRTLIQILHVQHWGECKKKIKRILKDRSYDLTKTF